MKLFSQFCLEAYDASVMGSSQIKKTGQRGEVGADRRKSEPEKRRMKNVGGGKQVPAKSYKDRTDIGTQRQASTRVQQPEKQRGSAAASQADAAKAERKKAALARIAARKGGKPTPEKKKDTPTASQLLSKKKTSTVSPNYKPAKESGYSRDERRKIKRAGQRLVRDIQQGKDKPASHYQP